MLLMLLVMIYVPPARALLARFISALSRLSVLVAPPRAALGTLDHTGTLCTADSIALRTARSRINRSHAIAAVSRTIARFFLFVELVSVLAVRSVVIAPVGLGLLLSIPILAGRVSSSRANRFQSLSLTECPDSASSARSARRTGLGSRAVATHFLPPLQTLRLSKPHLTAF